MHVAIHINKQTNKQSKQAVLSRSGPGCVTLQCEVFLVHFLNFFLFKFPFQPQIVLNYFSGDLSLTVLIKWVLNKNKSERVVQTHAEFFIFRSSNLTVQPGKPGLLTSLTKFSTMIPCSWDVFGISGYQQWSPTEK